MAFHLRLDEEAAKALIKMMRELRAHVASELHRLAESPTSLSRPAAFPHPLDGQLFDIRFTSEEAEHYVTVMFRYSADETHIDIAWITHLARPL